MKSRLFKHSPSINQIGWIAVLILCASIPSAYGQGQSEEWKFRMEPYLMGASMDGTTTLRGREVTVDLSAGDIFSNLQFGFMGYLEARKGRWGFGSDTMIMSLGATTEIPSANVDVNQLAWTFWGIRELKPGADLLFGARWNRIDGELDFKNLGILIQETKNWVDPVVGIRLSTDPENRVKLGLLGDIGGFGVGSDFAWEIYPTIGINLSRRSALSIGYRWIDVDYSTGEGNERFGYDVLSQGPCIGMSLNF